MTTPAALAQHLDAEACYRVVASRDRRFDGVFCTAVRSTGIYCRPSCPARTPGRGGVAFYPTAAAAQAAGYRACKRCLPDAVPGSPAWDAVHQGIFRNHRARRLSPEEVPANLPPLPPAPRGPFPSWRATSHPASRSWRRASPTCGGC